MPSVRSSSVAVVGGGIGGLSAAIRLAARGFAVDLFERNESVGGKLDSVSRNGLHFDIGPSLLTWPEELHSLFLAAEQRVEESLTLRRLDRPFRYTFADGSSLSMYDDAEATAASVEQLTGSMREWEAFAHRSAKIWAVAERTFFAGPMTSPLSLLRRMRSPLDLVTIDAMRTLAARSKLSFSDERLQMWLNRYATYSGSSPWKAPATLACIPHLEQSRGCWHVDGGLTRIADALEQLAAASGVRIHTSSQVERIVSSDSVARGLQIDGRHIFYDAVVAAVDSKVLYGQLIPNATEIERTRRADRSTSAFSMMLSLSGRTPGLAHHNVWFSRDQRLEFEQITSPDAAVADDPTIYVCCSAVTDPTQAPENTENWCVLVNTGAKADTNWEKYGETIVGRLGIGDRILDRSIRTPKDIESQYNAPDGSIYGTSSNGRKSAFTRAANRAPIKGLYVCGGSAHPGGGLPLVMRSGAIASGLLVKDLGS